MINVKESKKKNLLGGDGDRIYDDRDPVPTLFSVEERLAKRIIPSYILQPETNVNSKIFGQGEEGDPP